MANDSKQYQEEEYLFSEDGQSDPLNVGESTTQMPDDFASRKESFLKMWRKNLLIGITLIIVVFVVYKIISAIFSPKETKPLPTLTTQTAPAQIASTISQNIAANQATSPVASNTSSLHDDVNLYNQNRGQEQRLGKLEASVQNMESEISSMQDTVQTLQSSIDSSNAQLAQINTTLAVLNQKLESQENRLRQSQKKVIIKARPQVVIPRTTYRVLALIPGRAWLKSSRGATITVGEGSQIPGFGTVIMIDTQLGRVVTNSGTIIEYAPNDQ